MGCVVNGPGESKMANIGISLPGTGEVPWHLFMKMEKNSTLKGASIRNDFKGIIENYYPKNYKKK